MACISYVMGLCWPVLICPFKHSGCATQKGYVSSTVKSGQKDVECMFGILKNQWKILEYGIRFKVIEVVERVFVVCCMLHNMMLSEWKQKTTEFLSVNDVPLPVMPFG